MDRLASAICSKRTRLSIQSGALAAKKELLGLYESNDDVGLLLDEKKLSLNSSDWEELFTFFLKLTAHKHHFTDSVQDEIEQIKIMDASEVRVEDILATPKPDEPLPSIWRSMVGLGICPSGEDVIDRNWPTLIDFEGSVDDGWVPKLKSSNDLGVVRMT